MANEVIHEVPIKDIRAVKESGLNVRHRDVDIGVEDLARSIQRHGLLQPIVLRGRFRHPPYDLIVGQRRLLAHKYLGKEEIQARFKPQNFGRFKAQVESLIENLQRVKLNHADAAEAITSMYNHYNKSVKKVADEIGVSQPTVREYLKIEKLATPKAKKMLRAGTVTKEDVKRVIKAAQGNMSKADRLLDYLPTMTRYDKDRMAEYGEKHPKADDTEIASESKKPRLESTLILQLEPKVDKALEKAAAELDMNKESLAAEAVSDWLVEMGFLGM
ncbi:MAG: ParB/RepB/Spo0J family partition protein [Candidatus Aerophobus sp.]|nr:MAG: ParB/RepB/Spo0J family partition protein [Candidatus Aerophobus sp.]